MVEFKLVISNPKTGLSVQREAKDDSARALIGLKVGDSVSGESVGLSGFELQITGGSDYCGFPMRKDIRGVGRKKILAVSGLGFKKGEKGIRQRKTVCGNTVHDKIAQVNLKVIKEGKENIFSDAEKKTADNKAAKEAKKAERKAAEKPAEKNEHAKAKPAEKKEHSEAKHSEKPKEA